MEILKIENFSKGFDRLKYAKLELAGNLDLYEYKSAEFLTDSFAYDVVSPTTYYALNTHLEFQKKLKKDLTTVGIDLFNLPGIVYFKTNNRIYGLVPPIIEIYEEIDGKDNYALQDGVHRFLLAKQFGVMQKCIVIINKNANRDFLPYAHTNTWEEVILCDKVPSVKKNYRRHPNYSFMRPLRSIFDESMSIAWSDYGR